MQFITDPQLVYILAFCAFFCAAAWKFLASERSRFAVTAVLIVLSAVFLYTARANRVPWLRECSLAFAELALVQVLAVILFRLVLGRLRVPLIIRELWLGAFYVAIVLTMLTRLGVNLAGLIATSTVLTAIVGLSMQDALLNVVGGVVLQLEREIGLGDYIVIKDHGEGWVRSVRTRYTAIETPDGDLVLIPNNVLIKNPVTVLGDIHRHRIPFCASYQYSPAEVCEAVQKSLAAAPPACTAADPPPQCMLVALHPGHIEYSASVYQNRPRRGSSIVSDVLTRVYYALARAGYPLMAVPQNLDILQLDRRSPLATEDRALRIAALRKNEVFGMLAEEELDWLAGRFVRLPFAPGELVVKQGRPGESLYLVNKGRVRVVLESAEGRSQHVADLGPGSLFGEMSLLTGELRAASVVAGEPVECDRLDKDDFSKVLLDRPELAQQIALVLATRQSGLAEARERLSATAAEQPQDLLARIQRFFGLGKKPAS
jgi:small-conductance mechanosensitive channel/CRP-like cAMP-binding protein